MSSSSSKQRPEQEQERQPGREYKMQPEPQTEGKHYKAGGKLDGKTALISGGDSGIGRSVAIHFAKEGASVAIIYLEEDKDARNTRQLVERHGGKCLLLEGDVGEENFCREAIEETVNEFGRLDILINNAAEQHPRKKLEEITREQIERTFRTNIFSMFFLTKAALAHLGEGGAIINTTSVTAYRGSPGLLDYSSTKGAIVSFTRSLSGNLAEKKIRVNAVAPGPIWTPLIPATFPGEKVESFGSHTPLGRAGQPEEVAPAFVFLASQDSSYITGQVLHINGGEIVGG